MRWIGSRNTASSWRRATTDSMPSSRSFKRRSTHPKSPIRRGKTTMPRPLTITTPGDRDVVVVREFDAPRDLVWLCYSKPELVRRWYGLPDWQMTVCEIDFRVGGKWRYVTKAPSGYEMGSQGLYTGIVEPERIEQTEYYDDDWTKGGSENSVVFTETDG